MRNSELRDGTKMIVVKINHFVTLGVFSKALTNHFYNLNQNFNKKLLKKEAENILKDELFFHGIYGQYEHGYFESSFEEGEKYNSIFSDAEEWVKSKYNWLNVTK